MDGGGQLLLGFRQFILVSIDLLAAGAFAPLCLSEQLLVVDFKASDLVSQRPDDLIVIIQLNLVKFLSLKVCLLVLFGLLSAEQESGAFGRRVRNRARLGLGSRPGEKCLRLKHDGFRVVKLLDRHRCLAKH